MYNSSNWYWLIPDDAAHVWSSAKAAAVVVADTDYVAWLEEGNTPSKASRNDAIKITIEVLEATVTARRLREAVLGTDGGWMEALNTKIAGLRALIT